MKQLFFYILFLGNHVLYSQTVTVQIISPANGQVILDSVLKISVAANSSEYEIASVNVTVNTRQISLTYDPQTSYFKGNLSLTGLPKNTPLNLNILAVDFGGNQNTANTSFTYNYDPPPVIILDFPKKASNANPYLRIKARCIDNGPCTLHVSANKGLGPEGISQYYSKDFIDSVDTTINLSSGEGSLGFIVFTATDSVGQSSTIQQFISVESSPFLTRIFTAESNIRDFNFNKVFTSSDSTGKITDIITGASEKIPSAMIPDSYPQGEENSCRITKYGAMFFNNSLNGILQDYNDSVLYPLYPINSPSSLLVAGDFASWSNGSPLYLRDLKNITTKVISDCAGNWRNDLTQNGIITYWDCGYNISRYENDTSISITTNAGGKWNTYPLTDGTNIVFIKSDPCCTNQNYSLYLYDGNTETELSNFGLTNPQPGAQYQVNNKWIAYSKKGPTGILQIWLRDSAGNQVQKTFFNTDSYLDKLDDKGNFTFYGPGNHNTRYFANRSTGELIPICSNLGKTYYIDSTWYLVLGSGVYKIDTGAKLYISVADGNWNNPSVWADNTVPPAGANVAIKTNVVCNINTECYTLKILPPGSLTVNTGITLSIVN